ncbi:MAG: hypothetical protein WCT52_04960 [Candidatus Micrarchaeia archaeon]
MAEEKKSVQKDDVKSESMLGSAVDEIHRTLADKMKGRPYLLVVATGFDNGKEGDSTIFAAQWAWRSNVYYNKEEGDKLMEFLTSQLSDAANDPEIGIRKTYAAEKDKEKKK